MSGQNLITFTASAAAPDALKGKGLVLIDFWAPWCGPCRKVGPIIEELADDYQGKVHIGKLNVDEEPQAAIAYDVTSIPTMILFQDGEIVERIVGLRGKSALVEMLQNHIVR